MEISMKRVFQSVVLGHLVGMGLLVLLSCTAIMLSYPSKSVMIVGILALSLGAAFIGFYLRGKGASVMESLLSGGIYALIPFVVSLFGKGEILTFGYRLILVLVMVLLAVMPGWLFHKRKKRRRATRR